MQRRTTDDLDDLDDPLRRTTDDLDDPTPPNATQRQPNEDKVTMVEGYNPDTHSKVKGAVEPTVYDMAQVLHVLTPVSDHLCTHHD